MLTLMLIYLMTYMKFLVIIRDKIITMLKKIMQLIWDLIGVFFRSDSANGKNEWVNQEGIETYGEDGITNTLWQQFNTDDDIGENNDDPSTVFEKMRSIQRTRTTNIRGLDTVKISVNTNILTVPQITEDKVESTPEYVLMNSGTFYGIKSCLKTPIGTLVAMNTKTFNIAGNEDDTPMYELNPMILVNRHVKRKITLYGESYHNKQVTIVVKTKDRMLDVIVTTTVHSILTTMVKVKGRPKKEALAITCLVPINKNYIYSGAVITVKSMPFIVSDVIQITAIGMSVLLAASILNHDTSVTLSVHRGEPTE